MKSQTISFVPQVPRPTASPIVVPAAPTTWVRMEVILKITERCNINCTYCYFFNSTNDDFKNHPPYMGELTVLECAKFLAETARTSGVQSLQIDFHGGEPMMMKKARFDEMCTTLYKVLADVPEVALVIQTNAMLVDDEWIDIFARHKVGIGISIDGPKEYHDKYRVDHQGNGTYDRTIAGLRKLQSAIWDQIMPASGVGVIFVVDPEQDARKVFSHFVDDLGLQSLHFLLPMYDHDTVPTDINVKISKYLCDLFDAWVERGDPAITIRYFRRLFGLLMSSDDFATFDSVRESNIAYTIASNGDIGAADDIRNTFPHLFWTGANVANTTLDEFLNKEEIVTHLDAMSTRSPVCKTCCWGKICDGGDLVGTEAFRYSRKDGFRNPSIYCDSIKNVMVRMTEFALSKGVSFEHISTSLVKDVAPDTEHFLDALPT